VRLGAFDIHPVTDGRFRLDGGAMFGTVPRVLWEQFCPADDRHRIQLSVTPLLIKANGKNILVDTGLGDKDDAKFQEMFAVDRVPPLYESLSRLDLTPEDIDIVINTHLHFDHAGGNTVEGQNSGIVSAFPKATYCVQRGEYDDAIQANERTRASYRQQNFVPVTQMNQWALLDGNTELLPGISVVVTQGHTTHHQSVKIESEGRIAFYLGDLIPTVSHLPLSHIMGYDLFPLQTLETKRWVLDRAFEETWLMVFDHDPHVQIGYVRKDGDGKLRFEEAKE
tara:strand:+ start:513 stop:1355 length:843 start_codon:yes stop_codon:yes gene_type:complete